MRSTASRVVMIILGVVAAVSIIGLITTVVLGVAGDDYDAYGELPIPGSGELQLPAGEVTISFHIGGYGGRGMTVPPLNFDIVPPPGLADPAVTEDLGATVSVNDDARRRVWFMKVPTAGVYRITTGGKVNGYVDPRMSFGRSGSMEAPVWVFATLAIVSVDLFIAAWWFRRRGRRAEAAAGSAGDSVVADSDPYVPVQGEAYVPTDQGVRLEQLKTISALRDSGALTEKEFQEEKRRILDGR